MALGALWHGGTQGLVPGEQCSGQVDAPRSYSALSKGLCSFCIISFYRRCIQTQVDGLPLAQVWLFCSLIVTATVIIPRTFEAPPEVQSLQRFTAANAFTVHFHTNALRRLKDSDVYLPRAVDVPFLCGWVCTQVSLALPVAALCFVARVAGRSCSERHARCRRLSPAEESRAAWRSA